VRYRIQDQAGCEQQVELVAVRGEHYELRIDGRPAKLELLGALEGLCKVCWDGCIHEVFIGRQGDRIAVSVENRVFLLEVQDGRIDTTAAARRATGGTLRAQMPGRVVKVLCQVGTEVSAGQGLLVIEAMKMENELRAAAAGTVRRIAVEPGQSVETGQILLEID
jgi:biotin carboxyl carrier protein